MLRQQHEDQRTSGPWPPDMVAVVPVFNHVATVGAVVAGLKALGAHVLVVDDGSNDGSGDAALAAGGELLVHAVNQGKGVALRTAFTHAAAAGYRQALTCDADGQHPIAEAERLAAAASDLTTIYVGERRMDHAPVVSRFGRWWSNIWSWIACGAWVGDSQSGLRVYPLPATSQLPGHARRYSYEVEVLVRGVWAGLLVQPLSVAVEYPPDRVSHFHKLKDNWRTAWTFTRLVTRRLWPKRHLILVERPKLTLRQRLHAILTSGLQPWPAGFACALGAAIGVAPIPGLQFAAAAFLSWRLGLNIPLVMMCSNLSFGPLLFVWGAVASSLGVWMRTGAPVWESYHAIFAEFEAKGTSVAGINQLMWTFLGDWVLGSLIVVPVIAVLFGALGYGVFRMVGRK
jgi:Glycosyl transferase family 2/Uncharacterized protein conserved in bacteria (DUF2062)